MKLKEYRFIALIHQTPDIDSGFVEFPFDVIEAFGRKSRLKVKALFDGYEYRGSLVKMGHHCHLIGLNKQVRQAIGKNPGDYVEVVIVEDTDERTVEFPDILAEAFSEIPEAGAVFRKLSYTHQKEYVEWINQAKKDETKLNRVAKCIEMLLKSKNKK